MAKAKKKKTAAKKTIARKVSARQMEQLKENAARAKVLNGLASNINSILKKNSYFNKHPEFYHKVLSSFLQQPSDNRFVLLNSINRMDLHPRYALHHLGGGQKIDIKAGKGNFKITVDVTSHPEKTKKVNCYCYMVLLLTWTKDAQEAAYTRQFSEWNDLQNPDDIFHFSFKIKPGVVHWLLCLMKQLRFDNEPVSVKLQGMRIVEVGTFDKNDLALLKQIAEDKKKKIAGSVKEEEKIVRVKGKKRKDTN